MVDKAAVFIDNGYFQKVLKFDFGEPRVSYEKFSDVLCGNCERFRTYFYDCPPYQSPVPTEDEKRRKSAADKFHYNLKNFKRFEVRLGRLIKISSNPIEFKQKGVDVLLSVDLVRLAWSKVINKAILVSCDSDFVPAVQDVKDAGVLVDLWYSRYQWPSDQLYQVCDDRFEITQDIIDKSLL